MHWVLVCVNDGQKKMAKIARDRLPPLAAARTPLSKTPGTVPWAPSSLASAPSAAAARAGCALGRDKATALAKREGAPNVLHHTNPAYDKAAVLFGRHQTVKATRFGSSPFLCGVRKSGQTVGKNDRNAWASKAAAPPTLITVPASTRKLCGGILRSNGSAAIPLGTLGRFMRIPRSRAVQ